MTGKTDRLGNPMSHDYNYGIENFAIFLLETHEKLLSRGYPDEYKGYVVLRERRLKEIRDALNVLKGTGVE